MRVGLILRCITMTLVLLPFAITPAAARHQLVRDYRYSPSESIQPQVARPHQSAADAYNNAIVEDGMTRDELDRKSGGY